MAAPNEIIPDGSLDFLGGQDASKIPDRIAENCYAAGINVSAHRGCLKPRWGHDKKNLTFPDGGLTKTNGRIKPYREIFETGKFQALVPYTTNGQHFLIVVIGGVIFAIHQKFMDVSVITITDGSTLAPRASRIHWSNAGPYLVLFDFPNVPVIIEGLTARRSVLANDEVPVSTIGTYNQNRLFVANAGNEFTAGDPVGSLAAPNAPITFKEVFTPASPFYGQIFQLSTNYNNDPITAMGFLQVIDTSTGIGPLLVATKNAIYSYATQLPRDQWEAGQFGSIVVYNAGIIGPRALVNVNSDVIFLSGDGQVRSLSMSRDEQKKWSKVPISREVENWLKFWDPSLMQYAVLGYFQNKIMVSCNPFRVESQDLDGFPISDYAHGGYVVLELDNVSGFGVDSKPSWAGLYTGVRPMDITISNERCFIISKDPASINTLYEINPETTYDTSNGKIRYARSRVYTREFNYQDSFINKEAHSILLNMEDIQGNFSLDIKYKPSHSPRYLPWKVFKHYAPWKTCTVPDSCEIKGLVGHQFRDMRFGPPNNDDCDPITQEFYRVFKKVQLQFTLEGKYWELHEFIMRARQLPENQTESICGTFPPVKLCGDCNDDWFVGNFEGCTDGGN